MMGSKRKKKKNSDWFKTVALLLWTQVDFMLGVASPFVIKMLYRFATTQLKSFICLIVTIVCFWYGFWFWATFWMLLGSLFFVYHMLLKKARTGQELPFATLRNKHGVGIHYKDKNWHQAKFHFENATKHDERDYTNFKLMKENGPDDFDYILAEGKTPNNRDSLTDFAIDHHKGRLFTWLMGNTHENVSLSGMHFDRAKKMIHLNPGMLAYFGFFLVSLLDIVCYLMGKQIFR